MAHFAELNNNIVKRVIVVNNKDIKNNLGIEDENIGISFCQKLFGGTWKQTSYSGSFRKNYAGVGYTFDPSKDAFIPPKPFNSWLLDDNSCKWQPPVPCPIDGKLYHWDELSLSWIENIHTL
jgi:hypothetical protein